MRLIQLYYRKLIDKWIFYISILELKNRSPLNFLELEIAIYFFYLLTVTPEEVTEMTLKTTRKTPEGVDEINWKILRSTVGTFLYSETKNRSILKLRKFLNMLSWQGEKCSMKSWNYFPKQMDWWLSKLCIYIS